MIALNSKRFHRAELAVYLVLAACMVLVPFLHDRVFGAIVWGKLWADWIKVAGYLMVFFVTVYLLVPHFLFRKKYGLFGASVLLMTSLTVYATLQLGQKVNVEKAEVMPPMEIGPDMPPMELGHGMPVPAGFKPTERQMAKSDLWEYLEHLLIYLLIITAGSAYKLFHRWLSEERRNETLENERLKSELALLRLQVSPHFLMNTLNNIHALILMDKDRAMDAVIRLSTLMRYLLYDTRSGKTSLSKELAFIESYFSLMRLRFTKNVELELDLPDPVPELQIPTMLFINFLENAFKHGVSYERKSFVRFRLSADEEKLTCSIENSVHPGKLPSADHYSGIGLANVRNTLALLYPDRHELEIRQVEDRFVVTLTIPV